MNIAPALPGTQRKAEFNAKAFLCPRRLGIKGETPRALETELITWTFLGGRKGSQRRRKIDKCQNSNSTNSNSTNTYTTTYTQKAIIKEAIIKYLI